MSKKASRLDISFEGVHRGTLIVTSTRRQSAVARSETNTLSPALSIPGPQVIEMIQLSNGSVLEAVALYVYPGDFERRGLVRNVAGTSYDALSGAETQYVIGGARVVCRDATHGGSGIDRDQRITIGLSDLIQSTSATLDLVTGELVETNNYYANGARESYRGSTAGERVAPEPMGFTGKEADEEVGLTYFGQRYLMAHLGRWASPDPLQTHAVGGGEALNGYHYVAGSVLQARDPVGLDGSDIVGETATSVRPNGDTWAHEETDPGTEAASGETPHGRAQVRVGVDSHFTIDPAGDVLPSRDLPVAEDGIAIGYESRSTRGGVAFVQVIAERSVLVLTPEGLIDPWNQPGDDR